MSSVQAPRIAELLDRYHGADEQGPVADRPGDGAPEDGRRDGRERRAGRDSRVGLAAAVVAEVDRQVAGRRHRQHDDLRATNGPPESESFRFAIARTASVASQTTQPARIGTSAPAEALGGRQRHQSDQEHPHHRQSAAVASLLKPSASRTGGPTTAGRGSPCRAANSSAWPRSGDRPGDVVLDGLLQPDHDRRRRARRIDQRPPRAGAPSLASSGRPGPSDRPSGWRPDGQRVRLQVEVLETPLARVHRQVARREAGSRSSGSRASSTFQSSGMASSDSTRRTPGTRCGATRPASSAAT